MFIQEMMGQQDKSHDIAAPSFLWTTKKSASRWNTSNNLPHHSSSCKDENIWKSWSINAGVPLAQPFWEVDILGRKKWSCPACKSGFLNSTGNLQRGEEATTHARHRKRSHQPYWIHPLATVHSRSEGLFSEATVDTRHLDTPCRYTTELIYTIHYHSIWTHSMCTMNLHHANLLERGLSEVSAAPQLKVAGKILQSIT